jgi:hypothetical protein
MTGNTQPRVTGHISDTVRSRAISWVGDALVEGIRSWLKLTPRSQDDLEVTGPVNKSHAQPSSPPTPLPSSTGYTCQKRCSAWARRTWCSRTLMFVCGGRLKPNPGCGCAVWEWGAVKRDGCGGWCPLGLGCKKGWAAGSGKGGGASGRRTPPHSHLACHQMHPAKSNLHEECLVGPTQLDTLPSLAS